MYNYVTTVVCWGCGVVVQVKLVFVWDD